ncbi:MAG TPA: hypothetical protein VM599_03160 [Thermoanaerobaculia bacterium]|nr:hypothetical protein [Thermoanaerobaculia bacterium]
MDLTVLIVNWNAQDELLHCLDWLPAAVGDLATKFLVVDNASRDDSVAAVRAACPDVEVLAREDHRPWASVVAWREGVCP